MISMKSSLLIVVPTLNSYQLLPHLVTSLQAQSWTRWKLIFVDGPSDLEHRQWLESCCAAEPRCCWLEQDPVEPGIFGAMNQGFDQAAQDDWILFWGSDDWAAGPKVLEEAMSCIGTAPFQSDLVVCRGRYVNASTGVLARPTVFHSKGLLTAAAYRRAMWCGATPPHQATLIGPGARRRLSRYAAGFRLSADLDYFLRLSRFVDLRVHCLDLELVHMADAGISGQQTQRRLQEVRRAYQRSFGLGWYFPFIARYIGRLASLLRLT